MTISKTKQSTNSLLICQKQVQQLTGLNHLEINILTEMNEFPKSLKFSKRSLWIEEEIQHWILKIKNSQLYLKADLLNLLNQRCREFNEASQQASSASRNLIYFGKVVKPRLRKQIEEIKDQLQLELI